MSLFTAKGKEAKESAKKKNVDLKKAYIKLKDGESIRVRLLSAEDYVEYRGAGDFNIGLYTTADISAVTGRPDPYTVAANSGIEKFEKLYAKKRYLFAFADIDSGEIRVFDATKGQGEKIMDQIDEYADSINDYAFTFKRVGEKMETSYNLMPIMKLKAEDKEKFAAFEGAEVPENYFESVLLPKTEGQKIVLLKEAGFPVADFFAEVPAEDEAPGPVVEGNDDATEGF